MLLSHLQSLQQLIHLHLNCLSDAGQGDPPVAAYSALTASSKLQLLDVSHCHMPAGVWQHVFSTGRQLPYLTSLNITDVREPLEGSRLVSCCPSLQALYVRRRVGGRSELLASLHELSALHTLHLTAEVGSAAATLQMVCQLTGLRELDVNSHEAVTEGVLQLSKLKQLTSLYYYEPGMGLKSVSLTCEVRGS
jgi:hypothetical protein